MLNKKIYYIANARMPTEKAHGIQLAKMCEAFVEQGIDLELVAPGRTTSGKSLKDYYGLRVDVPIKKIPVLDWYVNGRIGFFIGSISFAFGYFFYLWRKRLQGKDFIIYMTDIDQFSFFLVPFLGVPYFCEIHDAKKKRWPFVLLFRFASGIFTINSIIKKELSETFGIVPERIIVRPNGIDLNMFVSVPSRQEARAALNLPADKKIALYVGKIYGWKGVGDALIAARLLERDAAFYLVGGNAEELLRATGEQEIPQSFHCVGHRPFTEIAKWLVAADLLLVLGTKKNEYSYLHTSPMKFFEYMASRTPIVASATPANREVATDQEALFYEPDNTDDLAAKIRYAFAQKDEMRMRADQAFGRVQDFSWEKRSKSIIEFMENHL